MKKYIVFSHVSHNPLGCLIAEKKFLLSSSEVFQLFFEHQIAQDGRITLIYPAVDQEIESTNNDKVFGFREFDTIDSAAESIKTQLFKSTRGEKYILYEFIAEYEVETRKVLAIYDTYYALNSEEKYFSVSVTDLYLADTYKNKAIDYAIIDKEMLYQSIAYGFMKKLYKASSQKKLDTFQGLGEMFKSESLYRIAERNNEGDYSARVSIHCAKTLTFFGKDVGAEMKTFFPPSKELDKAFDISVAKLQA